LQSDLYVITFHLGKSACGNVEITTRFNNLLMINSVGNYFINKFKDGNCPLKKISSVISSLSVSSLLIKKKITNNFINTLNMQKNKIYSFHSIYNFVIAVAFSLSM